MSVHTAPYSVPFGIMVPKTIDNLLVPVAVSASRMGFGTLRMEPRWMALGEAAGTAANLMIQLALPARQTPITPPQRDLVSRGAMLLYFRDVSAEDPIFPALQYLGVRGGIPDWRAEPDEPLSESDCRLWTELAALGARPSDSEHGAPRRSWNRSARPSTLPCWRRESARPCCGIWLPRSCFAPPPCLRRGTGWENAPLHSSPASPT